MNGISIRKKLKYKQEIIKTFLIPAAASLWMGMVAFLVYYAMNLLIVTLGFLEKGKMHWGWNCACLIPSVVIAVCIYFALVIKFGALNREELRAMPKGRILIKVAQKAHLLS